MEFAGEAARRPPAPRPRPAGPGRVRGDLAPRQGPAQQRGPFPRHPDGPDVRLLSTNMPAGRAARPVDEVAYGMVVADGMGGMAAGEKASQLAIRTGVELVLNSPLWATRIDEEAARQLIDRMRDYFRKVDSVVIGEARADRHLSGMGTTLTFAYIVGDRRLHRPRRRLPGLPLPPGELEQLTRDHTMAQGLADLGAIRPEDVHRHAKRHVLTNFVGGPARASSPRSPPSSSSDGDYLLLCSDGLTEMVPDAEIARILGDAGDRRRRRGALVDRALEAGGRDNVTVVLAR